MAEFQWWLLLVGLVVGGGIVAVVYLDGTRREQDIASQELPAEAAWIGDRLMDSGRPVDDSIIVQVLREHRAYRAELPPDHLGASDEPWSADADLEAG